MARFRHSLYQAMGTGDDLKARVRDFWEAHPCGAKFSGFEPGSSEFFREVERQRYELEPHIPEVVNFQRWGDRDVLEVGCGLGTDGARFARAGARYTAIDLTPTAVELARARFQIEGLNGDFKVGDAEALQFDDGSFDLVYSHGVLHHTPNTRRAIDEINRVLRPGGTAMVMLYHRNSYNYYVNIMTLRRMGARLLGFDRGPELVQKLTGESLDRLRELQGLYRRDPRRFLSREEFLNNNTDGAGNPLARVYSAREAKAMFGRFSRVRTESHYLNRRWVPVLGRLMPSAVERFLGRVAGWHLWIVAVK